MVSQVGPQEKTEEQRRKEAKFVILTGPRIKRITEFSNPAHQLAGLGIRVVQRQKPGFGGVFRL